MNQLGKILQCYQMKKCGLWWHFILSLRIWKCLLKNKEEQVESLRQNYLDTYETIYEVIQGDREMSNQDLTSLLHTHISFKEMMDELNESERLTELLELSQFMKKGAKFLLKYHHSKRDGEGELRLKKEELEVIEKHFGSELGNRLRTIG